jgi:hypothetical protein
MKNFQLKVAPFIAYRETNKHGSANKLFPASLRIFLKAEHLSSPMGVLLKLRGPIEKLPDELIVIVVSCSLEVTGHSVAVGTSQGR